EADYVVVGAGSAGCVMAARLSEDVASKVVLLEAGGNDNPFWIHVPMGFGKTFADPRVNWMFETEPDPGGRRMYWPRGKVLGGSSWAPSPRCGPTIQISRPVRLMGPPWHIARYGSSIPRATRCRAA